MARLISWRRRRRDITRIAVAAAALLISTATAARALDPELDAVLRFEAPQEDTAPAGWGGGPGGTIFFDAEVVHAGDGAARIERDAESDGQFSSLTRSLTLDFGGDSIELRGVLRTTDVDGGAGLWLRQDAAGGPVQFTSMPAEGRSVSGTSDWTEYSIRLPLDAKARELFFGVLLSGEGRVWADDLELRVDGKPIAEAPERVFEPTVFDTDREFEGGSGLEVTTLSAIQIDNLALLGQVWGFLKYHHPRIAAGELHWDYELFRVLPAILEADRGAGNRRLLEWVRQLGVPEICTPAGPPEPTGPAAEPGGKAEETSRRCATPPENVHLRPDLDWIADAERLGPELSELLKKIYRRRTTGESFYVSQAPQVGNPIFDSEPSYPELRPPDAGYRILALLRLWNIIEYWFPYRDLLDDDWPAVLREFLPRMVAAGDWDGYRLELLALAARVRDTHVNLFSELDVRPPRGDCRWPVATRFVEGRATVTALAEGAPASGLQVGDVIDTVDGRKIENLVAEWAPYYAASNDVTRWRDIARFLPRGACGDSRLGIVRGGDARALTVERVAADKVPAAHGRPGKTFQFLSKDVAYLKLSSIRVQDVDRYLEAAGSRDLVIDIRNYPSEFVVFALGQRLVEKPTPFARFTTGDLDNPGAFTWTEPLALTPMAPVFPGRVAILVDEVSLSQAEYTAMAFRAGPRAVVVGSTTAGADGNVSPIPLPGGLRTMISGIGVFYPDKTPTQRVGIVPDIVATPTALGIREDRDEVLEAALRHLLGPDADPAEIRRMARPKTEA